MRNTLVSIALTMLGLFLIFKVSIVMLNAYTESCRIEDKRLDAKKKGYNEMTEYYNSLTREQRDSILHLWKTVKGYK